MTTASGANARPNAKKSSFIGGLLQTLLILLITLTLVAVFLEIGLRIFAPQIVNPLSGLFQPDTAAGYRLRPNVAVHYRSSEADVTFHTNEAGLRDMPNASPPTAERTMLVLGDSFTFGMNVQDSQAFPDRMASMLAPAGGQQWKVLNAGVFGYGTDNEAAWLEEYGWQQKPTVVVVGFFVGNDVKDVMIGITKTVATADGRLVAADVSKQAMDRGEEDQSQGSSKSSGVRGWLENNSHAYLFLRSLWYNTLGKGKSKAAKLTIFDAASFYRKSIPPEIESGWDKTFDILRKMQEACKAHGAQLVLVAIPTREQVYPKSWDEVKAQFALNESDFDLTVPQQKLQAFATTRSIPYVDLLPAFKAKNSNDGLYFHVDRHWTAAGHDLAAQTIVDGLKQQGLVK